MRVIERRIEKLLPPALAGAIEEWWQGVELTGPAAEPVPAEKVWHDLVYGAPVAAGADYVYTVHQSSLYPLSVMCRLTTSNQVADRSLTLEYRDPNGARFLVAGVNATVPASQTQSFCWQPSAGVGSWPVSDVAIAPLPQQILPPNFQLAIRLTNGDAGDLIDTVKISGYWLEESL